MMKLMKVMLIVAATWAVLSFIWPRLFTAASTSEHTDSPPKV
jgi:hypothetical protein